MLITIEFHKSLQQFTEVASHTLNVDKLSSIKDALVALFPKLRRYIYQISHGLVQENLSLISPEGTILNRKDYFKDKIQHKKLKLVPLIGGAGGKGASFLTIALGIALIGAALFTGGATIFGGAGFVASTAAVGGLTTAGTLLNIGIGLTLAGLMGALTKTPELPGTSNNQRRNNDMFESINNTTDPNTPVPLIYGMPRVGGQIISTHVETISHGESDIIYVRDLFYQEENEIEKVETYVEPPPPEVVNPTPGETQYEETNGGDGGI